MMLAVARFALIVLAVCVAANRANAQDLPTQEPQLVIDPGMHTAPIRRIGVDATCTLLATGSHDKTVRLWRLPTGRLLKTLRPPIDDGNEGKVYAVTVAPDGSWVAAGGWTMDQAGFWVYIFDANTGAVVTRLGPSRNVIRHLSVSADGQYLAATLGSGQGLRVWRRAGADSASWQLATEDKDYGGADSYGSAFARDGTLYTVASNGRLRRYAPGYAAKPALVATRGGSRPYTVSVHPSGDSVAVGFSNAASVDVYDAATLAWRFKTKALGGENGYLRIVAWSADGTRLFAGGANNRDGKYPVRVWDQRGQGSPKDLDGFAAEITHLLPCGDAIAVSANDPAFGLMAADGGHQLWRESVQADMRGKRAENFTVSADGQRVRFGLKEGDGEPVLFDLPAERLGDAPAPGQDLYAHDTKGLAVTDWLNTSRPKLNGKVIALRANETARSLAVAPDKQHFILGAEFRLRGFDKDGKKLWETEAPGVVWGVNVSRDGKVVVAAYGDGTIRWHRLDNGHELLALFVHAKDRRWVAWTPSGYYAASPGGEALVGWQLNRGWSDAGDFFPAHRFRNRFYRPDIVQQVLLTLDENKAIAEADRRSNTAEQERSIRKLLPPVIEILSPKDGDRFSDPKVTIQYTARSETGEKISDVEVYLDDAKVTAKGLVPVATPGKDGGTLELDLPRRDVKVTLVARSGNKASVARSVRLAWASTTVEAKPQPRLLALLVGVSAYKQESLKLDFANMDALNLAAALKAQEGKAFLKVETEALTNADRDGIRNGFNWLKKTARDGDLTLVLFSGHGTTESNTFYFLPAEADPSNLSVTAISGHEIVGTIQGLPGGKVLLIDACRAGGALVPAGLRQVPVDMNKLANDMVQPVGAIFFGSSGVGEFSYEDANLKDGVFTAALIEGLSGKADFDGNGKIETDEMGIWLKKRVAELTKGKQNPLRHQSAPVDYTMAEK